MEPDFYYKYASSIFVLYPQNDIARIWVSKKIHLEEWQDPEQVPVESCLFNSIFDGITSEGLSIERMN